MADTPTLYLKAATEQAMIAALSAVLPGLIGADEDGNDFVRCYTHDWALDWEIPIVVTPAVYSATVRDSDGALTRTSAAIMSAEFHANLRILLPDAEAITEELEPLITRPATPQRVFA